MELSEFSMPETNERRPTWSRTNRPSTYTRLMSSGRGSWRMRNPSTSSAKRKASTQCPLHDAVRRGDLAELIKVADAGDNDSLNALNDEGMTALHVAAKFFSKKIINFLLENGAQIDLQTSGDGSTALHYAVRYHNEEVADMLLSHGASAGITDVNGSAPLHFASSRGMASLVEKMLDTGMVKIDVHDMKYNTPLHYAARGCEIETCKILLERGASLEVANANGETPLHLAAEENNVEVLEIFLQKRFGNEKQAVSDGKLSLEGYIDKPRSDMKTALHIASLMGHADVVKFLISKGADVSAVTSEQSTPVHLAALRGNTIVLKLLLEAGSSSDTKASKGQTPLHEAALAGHTDVIKLLLDRGADINAKDSRGCTPLLNAVKNNFKDAAVFLLESHANTSAKDENLKNALHFACEHGNYFIVALLIKANKKLIHSRDDQNMTVLHYAASYGLPEILKLLMSKTMHLVDIDSFGQTPLHLAAKYGHVSCVSLLAGESEKGTVNHLNSSHQTPLHLAVIQRQLASCKALIKYGADLNCTDNKSWTPLHYAAVQEGTAILNTLLHFDVDIDFQDDNGNTPLMVAAEAGKHIAVGCLMDAGADLDCVSQHETNFFDIALEFQREHVCQAILKHDRWQEALALKSQNKCYYMSKLIKKYPDVAEIALDRSCTFSDHSSDHPDLSITYDYQFIEEYPKVSGNFIDSAVAFIKDRGNFFFAPSVMGEYGRQALISHPITKSLFTLKWKQAGRYLYYLSFLFYLLFVISLNISVLLESQSYVFTRVKELNVNSSSNAWRRSLHSMPIERPSSKQLGKALGAIVCAFCIIQIFNELVQLIVLRLKYFTNFVNYLEVALYVTSLYYILTFLFQNRLTKVTYEVGIICTFLGWVNVMFYLQRVPMFRVHIVMFIQVCLSILKVIVVFAVIIMAFALTFYMLFIRQTSFINPEISAAKVFVMMTGEFDYDTVLTGNLNSRETSTRFPLVPFPGLSYAVFIGFVFLIALAFTNLLIGLAVGDIESIRELATLTIQRQQLDFINNIQGILPVTILRKFMSKPTHTEYLNRHTKLDRAMDFLTNSTNREELLKLRIGLLKMEGDINTMKNEDSSGEDKAIFGKAAILEKLITKQQRMFEEIRSIRDRVGAERAPVQ